MAGTGVMHEADELSFGAWLRQRRAAQRLREDVFDLWLPVVMAAYEGVLARLRAHLDDATFAAAWADGRTMSLEEAVAYAVEEVPDA